MKVTKTIETVVDVEVDVSIDDVISEIAGMEPPRAMWQANRLISTCMSGVMRMPDNMIALMTDLQRKTVAEAMTAQAARYMPSNL